MAYSVDYKKRVLEYKKEGHTFKEILEVFKITSQTYYTWEKQLKNGNFENRKYSDRKRKIDKEKLLKAVEENPDAYLCELADLFECSSPAILYILKKYKITRKKRPSPMLKNQKKSEKNI